MLWIGEFFSNLFKSIGSLFAYFQQNQLVQAGQDKETAKNSQAEVVVITEGDKVREETSVANAAIPVTDSLPTDGYRRD